MKIKVYRLDVDFFEIVSDEIETEGELMAQGEHVEVINEINKLLGTSTLDFGVEGFDVVTDGTQVGTIENENKWLLLEVIPFKKARIFKNPTGKTQTKLRTWKGTLTEVILALYEYIESIDVK